MPKSLKFRASKVSYVSQNQLSIDGFDTLFSTKLDPNNRWVILAHKIPWDRLVSIYNSSLKNSKLGADSINPRVAIGSIIIKHICDLSDRETVQQIRENMYMQYFIGYTGFTHEEPFDPSLFVGFRKRLSIEKINEINQLILSYAQSQLIQPETSESITHQGKLIIDATACPQDIAYPTDLDLLNDARQKTDELIGKLYSKALHKTIPRRDSKKARKQYLRVAQMKSKPKKKLKNGIKSLLTCLKRNLKAIDRLLDAYPKFPLDKTDFKYMLVCRELLAQQKQMYNTQTHSVADRIVSIHQPHVRPIVRGKASAKVEFGAKIQVSLMNGYAFLDKLSWDAFNEGGYLISSVEDFKKRCNYYPEKVLVDKIYCTRSNRKILKELGIKLAAKPLGRPKAGVESSVSPGERNPIEGKFGQAKKAYGLGRINARTAETSQSWIACILMVLNLVKMIGEAPLCVFIFGRKNISLFLNQFRFLINFQFSEHVT